MLASQAQTRAKFPIPQFRFNCRLNALVYSLLSFPSTLRRVIRAPRRLLDFHLRRKGCPIPLSSSSRHTIATLCGRSTAKDIFAIIRFDRFRHLVIVESQNPSSDQRYERVSIGVRRENYKIRSHIIRNNSRIRNSILVQIYFSNS